MVDRVNMKNFFFFFKYIEMLDKFLGVLNEDRIES